MQLSDLHISILLLLVELRSHCLTVHAYLLFCRKMSTWVETSHCNQSLGSPLVRHSTLKYKRIPRHFFLNVAVFTSSSIQHYSLGEGTHLIMYLSLAHVDSVAISGTSSSWYHHIHLLFCRRVYLSPNSLWIFIRRYCKTFNPQS